MTVKKILANVFWRAEAPEDTKVVNRATALGFAIGGLLGSVVAGLYFPTQPARAVAFGTFTAIGAYSGRAVGLIAARRTSDAWSRTVHAVFRAAFGAVGVSVLALLCYAAVTSDSLYAIVAMTFAALLTLFSTNGTCSRWLGLLDFGLASSLLVIFFRTQSTLAVIGVALCALASGYLLGQVTPDQTR